MSRWSKSISPLWVGVATATFFTVVWLVVSIADGEWHPFLLFAGLAASAILTLKLNLAAWQQGDPLAHAGLARGYRRVTSIGFMVIVVIAIVLKLTD